MAAPRLRSLLASALFVVLAGCTAPETLSSTSETTMTLLLSDDWAAAPAVADAITDFEEVHGVRVAVRSAQFGQLEEFMLADRSGSREIDVSQWHAFAAGSLGYARPVTARFEEEYPEGSFVPGAIEDVSWGDEVYGVPLDVNAVVLIVNTDLLGQLGFTLDDLATWEQAREVAEAAAEQGVRLTHLPASTWTMYAWVRANGGRWLEVAPDGRAQTRFDSAEVVETFDYLSGLVADELAYAAADVDTSSDALPLFQDQQTLALTSGTWDVAGFEREDPGFAWGVRPMPLGPSADGPGTVLGGSSLYVTEQAEDPELAWELMTHLVEPEYARRYAREDGRLPGRTDVLEDPFFDQETFRVAVEELPSASAMRLIAFPRVFDLATRSIYEVLHGEMGAEPAFADLEERVASLTEPGEDA